ncbi:hypothetical protein ABTW72_19460 [Micromonospora sp. NPDC127501]|uniref:hypothetical protein n=1 Tax=Micromonospora sp. NPDC127501 TaxID=3154872 RepID=UPI003331F40A
MAILIMLAGVVGACFVIADESTVLHELSRGAFDDLSALDHATSATRTRPGRNHHRTGER